MRWKIPSANMLDLHLVTTMNETLLFCCVDAHVIPGPALT
jgi:hypothetical protein